MINLSLHRHRSERRERKGVDLSCRGIWEVKVTECQIRELAITNENRLNQANVAASRNKQMSTQEEQLHSAPSSVKRK